MTDLQFDNRKVMISGVGDGLALYNRVSKQIQDLSSDDTVTSLQYIDTYMVTGSSNGQVKCWAI